MLITKKVWTFDHAFFVFCIGSAFLISHII